MEVETEMHRSARYYFVVFWSRVAASGVLFSRFVVNLTLPSYNSYVSLSRFDNAQGVGLGPGWDPTLGSTNYEIARTFMYVQ